MASLKQIAIGFVILSVACRIAFAAMFTMLPGTIVADITGAPPEPVDFWPSF